MNPYMFGLFPLLLVSAVSAQERKLGIVLQVSSPSKDDIKLGWYDIPIESIDGYDLEHRSYAGGLLVSYALPNQASVRLRFGISRILIDESTDSFRDQYHHVELNRGQQTKLHFAPGITWSQNKNKFDLYGGFELPFNLHGEFDMRWDQLITDTSTGTTQYSAVETATLPKGYSFGIGALMGFSYHPTGWFSVGSEFSPSLLYAKLSGETRAMLVTNVPAYPTQTRTTQDENKGFTFYDQRFSLNFSFRF